MRDTWSLLVIVKTVNNEHAAAIQVIDFASPAWADVAYSKIREHADYHTTVIKLY